MQNTTTTTTTANFDKFAQSAQVQKACKIADFRKLDSQNEANELQAISRALKIGAIIVQGRAYLESPEAKALLKEYGIKSTQTDLLIFLYGYKRTTIFELIKAFENRERLPDFTAFLSTPEGKALKSKGYIEFNRWVNAQNNPSKPQKKASEKITLQSATGKKLTFDTASGESKSDMNAADLLPIVSTALNELRRLNAKSELESVQRIIEKALQAIEAKADLNTKRKSAKASAAKAKAGAKAKAQPQTVNAAIIADAEAANFAN